MIACNAVYIIKVNMQKETIRDYHVDKGNENFILFLAGLLLAFFATSSLPIISNPEINSVSFFTSEL